VFESKRRFFCLVLRVVDRRSRDDPRGIGLHSKGKLSREFEFKLFSIASWNPYFYSLVDRRSRDDLRGIGLHSKAPRFDPACLCVSAPSRSPSPRPALSCRSRCPPGESVHDDLRRIGLHSKALLFDPHRSARRSVVGPDAPLGSQSTTICEGLVCI
jgi:hypothetical protein